MAFWPARTHLEIFSAPPVAEPSKNCCGLGFVQWQYIVPSTAIFQHRLQAFLSQTMQRNSMAYGSGQSNPMIICMMSFNFLEVESYISHTNRNEDFWLTMGPLIKLALSTPSCSQWVSSPAASNRCFGRLSAACWQGAMGDHEFATCLT